MFKSHATALRAFAVGMLLCISGSAFSQFEGAARPYTTDRNLERRAALPLPGLVRKDAGFETTQFPARTLTLNGVNVSGLRSQEFENVQVRIDENGNVEITAPHYEVRQDSSYHPLFPGEVPRLPKERARLPELSEGLYSKHQGSGVSGVDARAGTDAAVPAPPRAELSQPSAAAPARSKEVDLPPTVESKPGNAQK